MHLVLSGDAVSSFRLFGIDAPRLDFALSTGAFLVSGRYVWLDLKVRRIDNETEMFAQAREITAADLAVSNLQTSTRRKASRIAPPLPAMLGSSKSSADV